MRANEAERDLRELMKQRNLDPSELGSNGATTLMVEFYRVFRATDALADGGDALLFEWGTHDWGQGAHFEYILAREFVTRAIGPDRTSQLRVTLLFTPTTTLRAAGMDRRRCDTREQLAAFDSMIRGTEAYMASEPLTPLSAIIETVRGGKRPFDYPR